MQIESKYSQFINWLDSILIIDLIDRNQATLSFIARGKMKPSRYRMIQLSIGIRSDKLNLVNQATKDAR